MYQTDLDGLLQKMLLCLNQSLPILILHEILAYLQSQYRDSGASHASGAQQSEVSAVANCSEKGEGDGAGKGGYQERPDAWSW